MSTARDDTPALIAFVVGVAVLAFLYGTMAGWRDWFPAPYVKDAVRAYKQLNRPPRGRWYYSETDRTVAIPTLAADRVQPGLTLVTALGPDGGPLDVDILTHEGDAVQSWDIDWHETWPGDDRDHIPEYRLPQTRPGTHIHGIVLAENGDIIFNFESLGLVRMDPCGEVVWYLAHRTHHSVFRDEHDTLWVPGLDYHTVADERWPRHEPPFREPLVLRISLEGDILARHSVLELLRRNGLEGLLYQGTTQNRWFKASGDTMHLNDIEVFPSTLPAGVFHPGDLMVSLRNISTVAVFRPPAMELVHLSTGGFVRQHDPDFIDGNTISVFDNSPVDKRSKIVLESVDTGATRVHYTGSGEMPFFTDIMGKHQWLPNGNVLITESMRGRAFEIDPAGDVVWEYFNIVAPGTLGVMEEATRLPDTFTPDLFAARRTACGAG